MENVIVESVVFRPKKEVGQATFEKAMVNLDDFVKKQPGFLSRRLARTESGEYLDTLCWQSLPQAKEAQKKIMESETCLEAFSLIDETTLRLEHYEAIHQS